MHSNFTCVVLQHHKGVSVNACMKSVFESTVLVHAYFRLLILSQNAHQNFGGITVMANNGLCPGNNVFIL